MLGTGFHAGNALEGQNVLVLKWMRVLSIQRWVGIFVGQGITPEQIVNFVPVVKKTPQWGQDRNVPRDLKNGYIANAKNIIGWKSLKNESKKEC